MNIYIDLTSEEARKGCVKTVKIDGNIYYVDVPAGAQVGYRLPLKNREGVLVGSAGVNSITESKNSGDVSHSRIPLFIAGAVLIGILLLFMNGGNIPESGPGSDPRIEDGIEKIIKRDNFRKGSIRKRSKRIGKYLKSAAKKGTQDRDGNTIVRGSIVKDKGCKAYIYTDSGGGLNVVQYAEDSTYMVGNEEIVREKLYDDGGIRDTEGILLYALDRGGSHLEDQSRALVDDINSKGTNCMMDDEVTVDDYKTTMSGKDYVIIDSHGSMLNYGYGFKNESSDIVPVICTNEDITDRNRQKYAEDISEQRIAKVTVLDEDEPDGTAYQYWIMPSFFTKYYGEGGLDNTYVHMGNCYGFGGADLDNSSEEDHALAESFISCGASAVTGYYNSVFTLYNFGMISIIMDELLSGSDLSDAVSSAKDGYGADDEDFATFQGWLEPDSPYYESADEKIENGIAYIVIKGNGNFNFRDSAKEKTPVKDDVPEGGKGEGYVVGEWVAYDEELPEDDMIGYQRIVFRPDQTGYTYFRSGSFEFTYTTADDGYIFKNETGEKYRVAVDSDSKALTLYYPGGDSERYYFEKFPDDI